MLPNSPNVIAALDRIAEKIGQNLDGLDKIASSLGGMFHIPQDAYSDPSREEVIIRYTVGTGEFSADKKYNVLRMKMFKMNGEEDGTHDGVWEPQNVNLTTPEGQKEAAKFLLSRPKPPQGPLDEPEGPIEHIPIRAFTKAIWAFGDGSSITAVGPANLHLAAFKDGSSIFLVSVAAIITNGTGRYQGAYGVKTALGSTFVPKGVNLFDPPGGKFGAVTVETFRVIRAEFVKS
jgi:hypothetical protein